MNGVFLTNTSIVSRSSMRRFIHGARPQARKVSRPDSNSSSASWHPVWPLPITSTQASGRPPGSGVVLDVDHMQTRREIRCSGGPEWLLVAAGGDHHLAGLEVANGGAQQETAVVAQDELGDLDTLSNRRLEAVGIGDEVIHQLVPRHETVRIGPGVGLAG